MNVSSHPEPSKKDSVRDAVNPRLLIGLAASLLVNLGLWSAGAAFAGHRMATEPPPIEITRVVIDKQGHKTVKVVTKKQIEKKVAQARKEIQKRRPEWKPPPIEKEKPAPRPAPTRVVRDTPPPKRSAAPPPPEGAHNKVLVANNDNAPSKPDDFTALPGGNASVGKPIEAQQPGNATESPNSKITSPAPAPHPAPTPAPMPASAPAPTPAPKPAPAPAPAPEPAPAPKPKKRGPSRDAEPTGQVNPDIPDELKHGNYKSFVRVKVVVGADGNFSPVLRTSSGNADIDQRVLDALKKWKWKPKLVDGEPVESVQLFKFEFTVE